MVKFITKFKEDKESGIYSAKESIEASETKVMSRRTLAKKIEENKKDMSAGYGKYKFIFLSPITEKSEERVLYYGKSPEAGIYEIEGTTKYFLPATKITVERATEEEALRDLEKVCEKYFPKKGMSNHYRPGIHR